MAFRNEWKINLNALRREDFGEQNCWQQAKHAWLDSDLPEKKKKESFNKYGFWADPPIRGHLSDVEWPTGLFLSPTSSQPARAVCVRHPGSPWSGGKEPLLSPNC